MYRCVRHLFILFTKVNNYFGRPTSSSLLRALLALEPNGYKLVHAITLLSAISHTTLSAEQRAQLIIPDATGNFHDISKVYYNDLGHRAPLVVMPDDVYLAHPKIDLELASALEMVFLGVSNLNISEDDDDEDMGENLPTRISNVLRQYSVEQAFGEFVSNAADAKACDVGFLIDEVVAPTSTLLCPQMAEFQQNPSWVIHNDAIFRESDFKGIRRVGTGGKESSRDTIGQFGLGALSMFHFCEVSIKISGAAS